MGFDRDRVVEVFARPVNGSGRVGSGYRVTDTMVLTAGHVVRGLPVRSPVQVAVGDGGAGRCEVRPLRGQAWVGGSVLWRDESADVAVIGLAGEVPPLPEGSRVLRWGRVSGGKPIAVTAVGFPWAQERPDRVRDSEQLFGFVAPATTVKAGLHGVTVQSAAPAGRAGGSPWAGMSGAALFAGPFLIGVVIAGPAGFGADRVDAAPVAPLLGDAALAGLLGTSAGRVVEVGPQFRLAVTAEVSVAVGPPYRAATERLGRVPARLLLPLYGIVPFAGRDGDLEMLEAWCQNGDRQALRLITGAGGSGKTRLAAEACVRMAGHGWLAGFADLNPPGEQAQLEFECPALLVVDDADLNVSPLADLIRAAESWPADTPPFRLLLLSRHTAGWWDDLNGDTDQFADELADPPLELHDGELDRAGRAGHHSRAVATFRPLVAEAVSPAGPVPPLDDPAFASPLLVHMHALLAVCGAQVPTTGAGVREKILGAVLDRERVRWDETFPSSVPIAGRRTRHQAVTVATLLTPPTADATEQAMTAIGDLADATAGARGAVADWLHELYPGNDPPGSPRCALTCWPSSCWPPARS